MPFADFILSAEELAQERAAFVSMDEVEVSEVPQSYRETQPRHSDGTRFYRKEFVRDDGKKGVVQLCTQPQDVSN